MLSISIDIGTLFVIAISVTVLLGLFLLFAWSQERIEALAWWGVAYLIGGSPERCGGSVTCLDRKRSPGSAMSCCLLPSA
jgi:hypothetical protein